MLRIKMETGAFN